MRLLVTDAAKLPLRQATAWLIMTLGKMRKRKANRVSIEPKSSLFGRFCQLSKNSYYFWGCIFSVLSLLPLLRYILGKKDHTYQYKNLAVIYPYQDKIITASTMVLAAYLFITGWRKMKRNDIHTKEKS